jgi:2-dehydro-3-deoxygalactonokinase
MLNDQPQFPASSAFVSCDWGTSALRLRWVDSAGAILGEVRRPHGCKAIFEEAQARAVPASVLYEQHLRGALTELARFRGSATQIPLVVSGMASSTIGWRELPYLEGPLALDGRNLRFEEISWDGPAWLGGTFLISGVAIRPEMMRGEETEAIGLLAGQPGFEGTLLLPGTHSKHLGVRDESVGSIATFMTGELFEVLALHSILKATVARIEVAGADFEGGVRHAAEHGLAASLFRVRTRAVLDGIEPSANAAFLSGLLIGDELAALLARKPGSIIVAGAPQLRELYLRALAVLSFERVLALSEEHLALAVPRAHALFLAGRSGA